MAWLVICFFFCKYLYLKKFLKEQRKKDRAFLLRDWLRSFFQDWNADRNAFYFWNGTEERNGFLKIEERLMLCVWNTLKFNFVKFLLQIFIEFCDGGALDTIIVDLEKGLTEKQIAYVCRGMCQGLVHLHKSGIIHRDLKAGNVLLTCQVNSYILKALGLGVTG